MQTPPHDTSANEVRASAAAEVFNPNMGTSPEYSDDASDVSSPSPSAGAEEPRSAAGTTTLPRPAVWRCKYCPVCYAQHSRRSGLRFISLMRMGSLKRVAKMAPQVTVLLPNVVGEVACPVRDCRLRVGDGTQLLLHLERAHRERPSQPLAFDISSFDVPRSFGFAGAVDPARCGMRARIGWSDQQDGRADHSRMCRATPHFGRAIDRAYVTTPTQPHSTHLEQMLQRTDAMSEADISAVSLTTGLSTPLAYDRSRQVGDPRAGVRGACTPPFGDYSPDPARPCKAARYEEPVAFVTASFPPYAGVREKQYCPLCWRELANRDSLQCHLMREQHGLIGAEAHIATMVAFRIPPDTGMCKCPVVGCACNAESGAALVHHLRRDHRGRTYAAVVAEVAAAPESRRRSCAWCHRCR